MNAATEKKPARPLFALLAGLQAGMLGVCWMLICMGLSSVWQRRGFWTAENLMASYFYGSSAIHEGMAGSTLSGLALYLLIYSSLGAVFAVLFRDRLPRSSLFLTSLLFSLAWYYVSFRVIWRSVTPLITLLHAEQATLIGHLIFGSVLARYPVYLSRPQRSTPTAVDAAEANPDTPPETAPVPDAEPAPPPEARQPEP